MLALPQIAVAILLPCVAAVAVIVLYKALSPEGHRSLRHVLQGVVLAAAATVLALYWASIAGEQESWRHVLVVYSSDLEEAPSQATARQVLVQALPPGSDVAFLRLSRELPLLSDTPRTLQFIAKNDLPNDWKKIAQKARTLLVLQSTGKQDLDRDTWLQKLVTAAIEDLKKKHDPLGRLTVLLFYDHDRTWSELRVPRAPSWDGELQRLTTKGIQLFVVDLPRERPRLLEVFSTEDVWPVAEMSALPPLGVRIPEAKLSMLSGRWTVRSIRGSIDGRVSSKPLTKVVLRDLGDGGPPAVLFHPSDIFPPESVVLSGYHRIELRVEAMAPGETSPRIYEGTQYILAERSRIALYSSPREMRRLSGEGWNGARPRLNELLVRPEVVIVNRRRVAPLGQLTQTGLPTLELHAFGEKAQADPPPPRATVIIEPTVAELDSLSQELQLDTAIPKGRNVLVIGPPAYSQVQKRPAWLPAASALAEDGEALVAYREPRLYAIPDFSRIVRLPFSAENETSLADLQNALLQLVRKKMKTGAEDDRQELDGKLGSRRVTILAPVDVTTPERDVVADYLKGTDGAAARDVAPGDESARLRALIGAAGDGYFTRRGVRRGHFYPETFVLLFRTSFADATGSASEPLVLLSPDGNAYPIPSSPSIRAADLTAMGIGLFIVDLEVPQAYQGFYKKQPSNSAAQPRSSTPANVLPNAFRRNSARLNSWRINAQTTPEELENIADEIISALGDALPPEIGMGSLLLGSFGRSIDPRVKTKRAAPRVHAVLEPQPPASLDLPQATIIDHLDAARSLHQPLPGIVARHDREGQVVVLAWSPLAKDVWDTDGGGPRVSPSVPNEDGWGLQRLLDLILATGASRPLTNAPAVLEIRQLEDRSTLQVEAWSRSFGTAAWRPPEIRFPGSAPVVMNVVSADPVTNRIVLQFRPEKPFDGLATLAVDPSESAEQESKPSIYLHLEGKPPGARSVLEALRALATFSGGAVIDPRRDPEFHESARRLQNPLPISFLVGAILCGLIFALLIPPIRPWTGAAMAWQRWWRRVQVPDRFTSHPAILDVEGILTEWGYQRGQPAAVRSAGVPSAQKLWDIGDDLAVARIATLVPFTSLGAAIGLPKARPSLRRRQVTRAMDALLLIDNSRGLLEPDGKAKLAPVIASLLARVVWMQAGSVSAAAGREAAGNAMWGPSTSDDDGPELQRWVRGCVGRPGETLHLPELVPGQVVFLLTDLMAMEDEELRNLAMRCSHDAIELRVAQLIDPSEQELVGLVWNVEAGVYHDRTQWTAAEFSGLWNERTERLRDIVRRAEGRFISLAADARADTIREQLREEGFLS